MSLVDALSVLRLAVFSKVRGARRYRRSEGLSWGWTPECPAQGEAGGGLCEISWRRPLLFCTFSCCPSSARPILSSSSLLESESAVAAIAVPFPVALSAYVAVRYVFCRGGAYLVARREFEIFPPAWRREFEIFCCFVSWRSSSVQIARRVFRRRGSNWEGGDGAAADRLTPPNSQKSEGLRSEI